MTNRHLWLRAATLFGRSIMTLAKDRNHTACPMVFAQFDRDGRVISVSDPISVGTTFGQCGIAALGRGRGVALLGEDTVVPNDDGGAGEVRTIAHWLTFRVAKGKVTYKPITEPLHLQLHDDMKSVVNGDRILWAGCTGIDGGSFHDSRLTLAVTHLGKSVTTYETALESNDFSAPAVVDGRVFLLNSAGYYRLELLDITDPSAPEVIAEIDGVKRAKPPRRQRHELARPNIVAAAGRLRLIWGHWVNRSKGKPWTAYIKGCDFDLETETRGPIEPLADDSRVMVTSLKVAASKDRVTATWENRLKGPSSGVQRGACFGLDDPLPIRPVSLGDATMGHLLSDRRPIFLSDAFYEPSGSCRISLDALDEP
jgi:hypothetical protein